MKGKTKLMLGASILLVATIIGAIVYACTIEGPSEVGLDYYSGIPAIVICRPIARVVDSLQQVQYQDVEVQEWIKGNRTDDTVRLKRNRYLSTCDLFFPDTTTYYFLPLRYYNYDLLLGPTVDSSSLTIPIWPNAFLWGKYGYTARDSIATFSEVSIIRHILSTQTHPFQVSVSMPDTFFVPGKQLLALVTIKNITSYQLVAPDSSKIDFLVQVFQGSTRIGSYEGRLQNGYWERIWWQPYEKENPLKLKSGESIAYIIDLSQRFPELSSFSYDSGRTLRVNALLNYNLIPLVGHSVRSDTLSVPFRVINSVAPTTLPTTFQLHQNYPNPFNPSTTISYDLPTRSHVTLRIFNVLGQEVATLVDGEVQAGRHEVGWNAARMTSGVYWYQLKANRFIETKKLILLR
jgi:hypothetical protein